MTDILVVDQLEQTDSVLSEVMHERAHQISKGYDAAHDDADEAGNHARAAAYYATVGALLRSWYNKDREITDCEMVDACDYAEDNAIPYPWPEEARRAEPSARDNLIKAAALIVAEIERIDREEVL